MRLGYSLNLEQTQKLIMTPELRQAITILQMPAIELSQYVEQELLENPLLEVKEDVEEEQAEVSPPAAERDPDWQEYFQDRSDLGLNQPKREEYNEYTYENFLVSTLTLQEHLTRQLDLAARSAEEKEIGEYLIGNIDDNGYLNISLEDAAQALHYSEQRLAEVLQLIQGFEPTGVGARNLEECLLLQLAQLEDAPPLAEALIKHHLIDLAAGKVTKIASALKIIPKEVQELGDFVRTLDPKPGRQFGSGKDVRYIVPDVVVEKVNGEYIVLINDTTVPRLGINRGYREALINKEDTEAKQFVENKLHAAAFLIRSIEQRRLTLYKVVNCIIDLQREFFDKGIKFLRPMTLREVAELVNLHESTVSRATSGKFMQAPQGVFELKFFFDSGVENEAGNMTSSESIKRLLKDLLDAEDSANPLSDQKVADILNHQGINISRRTVAKYREEVGIPSTSLRKRY
ncbi:MAG: RNA polymerase factor sigma-54 [Peptococcaceae bacterium]|nr:RNA polymerase factor sigma-54 [Peptococcaceae bacterium]